MLWFTFEDFYKKFEDDYFGKQEHKSKLIDAINSIPIQKRKKSQTKTLLELLEEAKPLVFEEPEKLALDHEWNESNDNLVKSLRQGRGSPLKVAALHYLFLSNPDYKAAADIMNEALFPEKTLEDVFPKEEEVTKQTTDPITSADQSPHWRLVTGETKSIDEFECKVAFEARQLRRVGEEVDIFAAATVPRSFEIANYEFSFKEVRIATNKIPNEICEFSHSRDWNTAHVLNGSETFKLDEVGLNRSIKISTKNGVLEGSYIFDVCFFLALKPREKRLEFSAELLTRGKDQNISKTDSTGLPTDEKKTIIQGLILKEIGSRRDEEWVAIAETVYKLVGDQDH